MGLVSNNTIEEVLAVHDSQPGDVFFLPAGRVHAIGAGNLLAEIQESSDITYRIYDYDRRDAQGNARELHTDLAKDAIDYAVHEDYKSAPTDAAAKDVEIARCDHFTVSRIMLDGEMAFEFPTSSFTVVMCLQGDATLGNDEAWEPIKSGETLLVPAAMDKFKLKGKGLMLMARS